MGRVMVWFRKICGRKGAYDDRAGARTSYKVSMGERIVKISKRRRLVGENLKKSVLSFPQTRGFADVDMSGIFALKVSLAEQNQHITIAAFFVKAVATSLALHPDLNARMEEDHFIYYDEVNVGVAVGTPSGLLVPVIKNADKKTLLEISNEIKELRQAIQNQTITLDAFRGGTVTVSSLSDGRMDSIVSIINNNEAMIIGFGRTRQMPVVDETGSIVAKPVCTVTLNLNHYIADGIVQSAYSVTLCNMLEHPEQYLL